MANIQIQNLYPGICAKLGGRTDLGPANSPAARYIYPAINAIRELTETVDFEELHVPSGLVTLNQSQALYSISTFVAALVGTTAPTAYDITDIADWGYWISPGATTGPWRTLKYRRKPTVDMYNYGTSVQAPPVYYTRYGSPIGITGGGNELSVGPVPNANYISQMFFKVRHPYTTTLFDSPIYVPDSWNEIIEYGAALRIAQANNSTEQINVLKGILYGDPLGRGEPGLIKARVDQMKCDAMHNERQLSMVIAEYGWN